MTNIRKRWRGFTVLILAMGTVGAQNAHKVAGPPLSPKPYRIGIAPSHITQPTAPLFKERAADWDEVRGSINFLRYTHFRNKTTYFGPHPDYYAKPVPPNGHVSLWMEEARLSPATLASNANNEKLN